MCLWICGNEQSGRWRELGGATTFGGVSDECHAQDGNNSITAYICMSNGAPGSKPGGELPRLHLQMESILPTRAKSAPARFDAAPYSTPGSPAGRHWGRTPRGCTRVPGHAISTAAAGAPVAFRLDFGRRTNARLTCGDRCMGPDGICCHQVPCYAIHPGLLNVGLFSKQPIVQAGHLDLLRTRAQA